MHYELLLQKIKTVNSENYSSQLDRLKKAIDEKHLELANWKCVIFLQDNAIPNFPLQLKLVQLD